MTDIDRIKAQRRAAVITWAHAVSNDLLGKAQREAPVDEGTLRGSGEAKVEEGGDKIEVTVSFSTVYAARQHEEVTWNHPKGGKAKYLSDPFRDSRARYMKALEDALRRASR